MRGLAKAILIGLGIFKIFDAFRTAIPWPLQPATAEILPAIGVSVAAAVWAGESPKEAALIGLGALGIAALATEIHDAVQAVGDDAKTNVMIRASGRSPNPPRRM